MKATKVRFVDMPIDYAGLVALYPPRPLHDAVDERNVEEIVNEMAGHQLSRDQEDYLNLMSDLLLKSQSGNRPARSRPRPVNERLRYLMEQSEMSRGEMAELLDCSQPLVSLMLSGKRGLSKENVKKLAERFKLDAAYFL
jgi:antitoxin component HigA of HigAB toxin-antitoxin module